MQSKKQMRKKTKHSKPKIEKMKKMLFCTALCLLVVGQVYAQSDESNENREAKRAEMIQKSGERLAKSFGLENAVRDSFLSVYTEYQTEMFATNVPRTRKENNSQQETEGKKDLTDAQATELIEANFSRQEQQVQSIQKRLDIQRRYYTRFQKTLTPAQILKAMFPQRPRPQGGNQQNGGINRRGGFGGPGGPGGFGGPDGF